MKPLPDPYPIEPLAKPPNCTITVPGSKSITNRALILAALAKGKCTLRGALWADDTQVMVDSLQKLGFEVTVEPDPAEECNRTITVIGRGGEIPAKKAELYVGNAGTAARFLTALVCLGHGEYRISGDPRMHERPMKNLFDALRQLQVKVEAKNDSLPAAIHANGLKGGEVMVSAKRSSQFASALLLIMDKGQFKLRLAETDEPYSYIEMTRKMIQEFGPDYLIEPDLSSGSYFVAVQAILGGRVRVTGWPRNSLQIDGRFPKFLPPPGFVSRARDLGDSVMILAICALFAKVPVVHIVDAERLREQESNRIEAMVTELKKVGALVGEHGDGFSVFQNMPGRQLHGADIETYNDHRMAMCFSVLGLKVPGIRIKNPQCVSKTFPNFFDKAGATATVNPQPTNDNAVVIAVDGPAASGKSTVSRALAKMLGYNYVDTGAMYRAITWRALQEGVDVEDSIAVQAMMHRIKITFEIVDHQARMLIDGAYPGDAVRDPRVTEKVSTIAAMPEVRHVLVQHQRSLTKLGSLVMEGRDIGTVVFPNTPYKFYLEASPEVRAKRRKRDLDAMKIDASHDGVKESLQRRDKKDSGRSTSPLQIALGATVIENSNLSVEENAKVLLDHIRQQGQRRGSFGVGGA